MQLKSAVICSIMGKVLRAYLDNIGCRLSLVWPDCSHQPSGYTKLEMAVCPYM